MRNAEIPFWQGHHFLFLGIQGLLKGSTNLTNIFYLVHLLLGSTRWFLLKEWQAENTWSMLCLLLKKRLLNS